MLLARAKPLLRICADAALVLGLALGGISSSAQAQDGPPQEMRAEAEAFVSTLLKLLKNGSAEELWELVHPDLAAQTNPADYHAVVTDSLGSNPAITERRVYKFRWIRRPDANGNMIPYAIAYFDAAGPDIAFGCGFAALEMKMNNPKRLLRLETNIVSKEIAKGMPAETRAQIRQQFNCR